MPGCAALVFSFLAHIAIVGLLFLGDRATVQSRRTPSVRVRLVSGVLVPRQNGQAVNEKLKRAMSSRAAARREEDKTRRRRARSEVEKRSLTPGRKVRATQEEEEGRRGWCGARG